MAERRVDRIKECLKNRDGRARLQQILEDIRELESNSDIPYTAIYLAIRLENERLTALGERTPFVTSREGEDRGWIRLRESSAFTAGSKARNLESEVHEQNERIGEDVLAWLQKMDWRAFESTFLTLVLEALGFQDVQITQATRDGGTDARVSYRRGIVEARAIVSAKRWKGTVGVEEVRMLRGVKGEEDTAIVVTTGKFTADAQNEAKPGQNQRIVYLIDGAKLVEVCMRSQIGVKKIKLPELLVLDPEVASSGTAEEIADGGSAGEARIPVEPITIRLHDSMLGDRETGLSVEEIADLTGYTVGTVRNYLSSGRRETLGNVIRGDDANRARAFDIISAKRKAD
jgi:restriction system protein